MNEDQAAKDAAKLLPCVCQSVRGPKHHPDNTYCPAYRRPAVAERLRAQGEEIERLRAQFSEHHFTHTVKENADLRAELVAAEGKVKEARKLIESVLAWGNACSSETLLRWRTLAERWLAEQSPKGEELK